VVPLPDDYSIDRQTMIIAAILLIIAGVLFTASALVPSSFDFAIAVTRGWHVTVFPPPVFVGVLAILTGIVLLIAVRLWR
jgi:hypothetical protein